MKKLRTLAALGVVALFGTQSSLAANKTWDGGGANNFWSTGANWNADTAPTGGDSIFFGGSFKINNTNDFASGTAFNGLTILSDPQVFSYNLYGNSINLSGGVTNLDNSLQTIHLSLNLAGNAFVSADHSGTSANVTINGDIGEVGGSRSLTKLGQRTLTLAGNNTFSGGLNIVGGIVQLNSSGALNVSGVNSVSVGTGTTLRLNGNSVTIAGLTGSGTVNNNSASTAVELVVNKTAGSDTFSGVIQDGSTASLAITKTGGGTLVLSGANIYTGGTTLAGGTIQLGSGSALGTGGLDMAGGILNANNQTISIGALTLSATSTLNLLDDANNSSLTFSSAAWTSGNLTINGWTGIAEVAGDQDRIFITAAPDAAFLSHVLFQLDSGLYFATMSGGELVPSLTPVPEPTEWALIIFGVLAVCYKFVLPRIRKSSVAA